MSGADKRMQPSSQEKSEELRDDPEQAGSELKNAASNNADAGGSAHVE